MSFPVREFKTAFREFITRIRVPCITPTTESAAEWAARWGFELGVKRQVELRWVKGFEEGKKAGFAEAQQQGSCLKHYRDGVEAGEAKGKIIGFDLAVEELRLKFWKTGFNAAQQEFKRLLAEQRRKIVKWKSQAHKEGASTLLVFLEERLK